jgi:hypothetical protein
MTLGQQSSLVALVCVGVYLVVGVWLLYKGWLVRAGVAMLGISLLPLLWQARFTDSNAKGFGVLLILMIPIPLLLIVAGAVAVAIRGVQRVRAVR